MAVSFKLVLHFTTASFQFIEPSLIALCRAVAALHMLSFFFALSLLHYLTSSGSHMAVVEGMVQVRVQGTQ